MRTTVTVDHDVDQLLRLSMEQTGQTFKVTLNQAIRKGLANVTPDRVEKPFVIQPTSLGVRAGVDPSRLQELGDDLEVDAFLSLTDSLSRTTDESR
jgi:hypothetical protein